MSASDKKIAADLQSVNQATLATQSGSSFPIVTLADGRQVPTGTVGALLVNIKAYDAALKKGTVQETEDLEKKIIATVPVLKMIGMFDLFSPDEWIAGDSSGRKLIGKKAKE